MADTPRVTVPVDVDDMRDRARYLRDYAPIVSAEMYGGERPSGIWNLNRAADLLGQAADALSAAPAPEDPVKAGEDELKAIARIIFPESERAKMDREWGGNRNHSHNRWNKALGQAKEILALRTQPQAREDAQPASKPAPFEQGGIGHAMYQAFHAYRADYVLSTDGADYEPTPFERDLIEDFFAGLMAEEAFFGPIRALYDTHPAPDALRVITPELAAEFANIDGPWTRGQMEMEEVWSRLIDAQLAALQAEQKGGA